MTCTANHRLMMRILRRLLLPAAGCSLAHPAWEMSAENIGNRSAVLSAGVSLG
jgi:hypothetical protein